MATATDLSAFQELIRVMPKADASPMAPTYLEVSGFHDRETLLSNYLAFFFDARSDHGLGAAFLKGLLDVLTSERGSGDTSAWESVADVEVEREVAVRNPTGGLRYIDLVITAEQHRIVIEHKVHADLYNELSAYRAYGESLLAGNDPEAVLHCVVLAPRTDHFQARALAARFVPVDYLAFVGAVRKRLGEVALDANPRYWPLMKEVLQTMIQHASPNHDYDELRSFLEQNEESVNALAMHRRNMQGTLRRRAKDVLDAMEERHPFIKQSLAAGQEELFLYKPPVLMSAVVNADFDVVQNGSLLRTAVDVVAAPTATHIEFFERAADGSATRDLDQVRALVESRVGRVVDVGREGRRYLRLVDGSVNCHEPREIVADKVAEVVRQLLKVNGPAPSERVTSVKTT